MILAVVYERRSEQQKGLLIPKMEILKRGRGKMIIDQWSDYLGGKEVAGGILKEDGTAHWQSPNHGATNESGFFGRPGGEYYNDEIKHFGTWAAFWSTTVQTDDYHVLKWCLRNTYSEAIPSTNSKFGGLSVRCVKD